MSEDYSYEWRGELADAEMVDLVRTNGGDPEFGWWSRVRPHSLGWVTAREAAGTLVGFVNLAWDGAAHAFLLDPKVHRTHQHRGIGTRLVEVAVREARAAGCEWLHVDFSEELAPFYFDACGFQSTSAGLIHLR